MASQLIKTTPQLKIAVESIGTMPMEAGSGVMVVVAFILLENNGEIGR